MRILTGVLLVLATWSVCMVGITSFGLLAATWTDSSGSRITLLRRSIWWGLLIASIEVCALSIFFPMHSTTVAVALIFSCAALGLPGWLRWKRRQRVIVRVGRVRLFVIFALISAQIYWAIAALGPVTGYDAGLYHLGAIRYAADFAALPGLSNLYGPLGYGTAEFPLGAVLGNGPWGSEGFRLLNGLFLAMVAFDLVLRLTRKRLTAGTYVLIVGIVAAWIPMIALSDFWVTSPSQDSAVLALTLVSVACLVDATSKRRGFQLNLIMAGVVGVVMLMVRSTMVGFLLALLVVSLIFLFVRREYERPRLAIRAISLVSGLALLGAITVSVRDYFLSGWLQYPLSVHAFNVPWLAPDPSGLREATLGFARDPERIWQSVSGWAWIPAWVSRLPHEWAFAEFLVLSVAAGVLLTASWNRISDSRQWRILFASMVPSAFAVGFWWIASPPAFRFAWGPLFTLCSVPLGWSLWRLSSTTSRSDNSWIRSACVTAGCIILGVTGFSAAVRLDWNSIAVDRDWSFGLSIPYAVAPIIEPPVARVTLPSGITIVQPTQTDQCWNVYPLCTPGPASGLTLRGTRIDEGFSSESVAGTS